MISSLGHYEVHLRDYLYILRKRRFIIFGFILMALVAAIFITVFEKVVYRATATILIEKENPNVVDFKEVMALDGGSNEYYQTQCKMLRSITLIESLVREAGLDQDPHLAAMRKGFLRRFLNKLSFVPGWSHEFTTQITIEDAFIRRMLRVDPVRNSRLVEVSVIHPLPNRSQELANKLVELFIRRSIEDRFMISKQATDMISIQLIELKEKVVKAEHKLQNYKEKNGLVNIPSIRENNKFLQDARLELVKLQSNASKLAKRYLPAHPKMVHLKSQIEGLEEKIQEEEARLMDLSHIAVDYAELEREAKSARQIYESLLSRLQETTSESRTQFSNIMIVDRAKTPARPYRPQPVLNLLMALVIGGLGGVFLAFFTEYLDSTIKIPEDIEKALGLELLGIIPKAGDSRNFFLKHEGLDAPSAESIRALRTALLFRLRHVAGSRVILVTSPNPEEGKSTVIFNLAVAFQQNHLKVLLIDADLRKPKLHRLLQVSHERGLTDVLEGENPLQDAILTNAGGFGFDFLSSGSFSHHPTEVLGTDAMGRMLHRIKENYDIVLIDSPPYLAVADVAVISEHADAILVIARYQRTDRRHLRDLKKRFSDPANRVLGVAINQVEVTQSDYYYQQYYYYGYGNAKKKQ